MITTLITVVQHAPQAVAYACIPVACALALFGFGRKKKAAPTVTPSPPASEDIDEETIAIITAAAMEALRKPVEIKRIRFLQADGASSWSVIGRLNIMGSHLITKWK